MTNEVPQGGDQLRPYTPNKMVAGYIPLADFLAKSLGNHYEVVLHVLSDGGDHVIALFNGHVSGRDAHSLSELKQPYLVEYFMQNQDKNFIANYSNRTPAGKVLASSTYFIKDDHQKLIGCICLNCDTSLYLELRDMLNQFLEQKCAPIVVQLNQNSEADLSSFAEEILEQTLSGLDLSSKRAEDKKDVIRQLNRRGIFLLKGTVDEVAHRLDISTQTLYRYLKDLS